MATKKATPLKQGKTKAGNWLKKHKARVAKQKK